MITSYQFEARATSHDNKQHDRASSRRMTYRPFFVRWWSFVTHHATFNRGWCDGTIQVAHVKSLSVLRLHCLSLCYHACSRCPRTAPCIIGGDICLWLIFVFSWYHQQCGGSFHWYTTKKMALQLYVHEQYGDLLVETIITIQTHQKMTCRHAWYQNTKSMMRTRLKLPHIDCSNLVWQNFLFEFIMRPNCVSQRWKSWTLRMCIHGSCARGVNIGVRKRA